MNVVFISCRMIFTNKVWYQLSEPDDIETPALLVYPDRIIKNIDKLISAVCGNTARLMPHLKTAKMAGVVELLVARGVWRFKCATLAEAEMIAQSGAAFVLVAYPLVGPAVARFIQLCNEHPAVSFGLLVECRETAGEISFAANKAGLIIPVWIDLNGGMNRTGFPIDGDLLTLYQEIADLPGLVCRGLHLYDGHIRHSVPEERNQLLRVSLEIMKTWHNKLAIEGFPDTELLVGGTPGFPFYANDPTLICSPGHAMLWDFGYSEQFTDIHFDYAALVLTRVVAKPSADLLTFDIGFKAIASQYPIDQRIRFPDLPDAEVVRHNEEHLVLKTRIASDFTIGDVLYAIPYHIGGTINLYDHALVINTYGEVVNRWPITRHRTHSPIHTQSTLYADNRLQTHSTLNSY